MTRGISVSENRLLWFGSLLKFIALYVATCALLQIQSARAYLVCMKMCAVAGLVQVLWLAVRDFVMLYTKYADFRRFTVRSGLDTEQQQAMLEFVRASKVAHLEAAPFIDESFFYSLLVRRDLQLHELARPVHLTSDAQGAKRKLPRLVR